MSFRAEFTNIESTYFLPVGLFNDSTYDERLECKSSPARSDSAFSSSPTSRSTSPLASGATTPSERGETPLSPSTASPSSSIAVSLRASPTFSTSPISWGGAATPVRKRESPLTFSSPSSASATPERCLSPLTYSPSPAQQRQEIPSMIESALLKQDYKEALRIIGALPKPFDRNWEFSCLKIQLMDLLGQLSLSDLSKFNLRPEHVWTWHLFAADILARKQKWNEALKCIEEARKNRPLEQQTWDQQAWRVDTQRALILFLKEGRESKALQEAVESIKKQASTAKARILCFPTLVGMYSFLGRFEQSREILDYILKSRDLKMQWTARKVELVVLGAQGRLTESLDLLDALEPLHEGNGSYWLMRMQMQNTRSEESALAICQILKRTLHPTSKLSKSGELWCEYARFLMDPFAFRPAEDSPLYVPFSFEKGEEALNTALKQTPQYGDTYIEYLNLLKMRQAAGQDKSCDQKIEKLKKLFLQNRPHQGLLFSLCVPSYAASYVEIWDIIAKKVDAQLKQGVPAEPTAFGIRFSNLGSLIQWGKISEQQVLLMLMRFSQFSPYKFA